MTFLEAAIEVLRHESEPLHFAEIAKRAVGRNLLSHVGRDPEAAMRTCLNSAIRGDQALLVRSKPGYYAIRPGAELPPEPSAPAPEPPKVEARPEPKPEPRVEAPRVEAPRIEAPREAPRVEVPREVPRTEPRPVAAPPPVAAAPAPADEEEEGDEEGGEEDDRGGRRKRRRGRFGVRGEAPPPQLVAVKPSRRGADTTRRDQVLQKVQQLEFEAPRGAGLDGVTDVALVMANAMSRLAEERPELRNEFESLQRAPTPNPSPTPTRKPLGPPPPRSAQPPLDDSDERGGRRRRRRKRRGRRVEWTSEGGEARSGEVQTRGLLQQAAQVLMEAGARSLHIRQIAEQLAGQGMLGGEISEIERAVTAAILLDIRRHGRGSRFVARGDARYQLQTSRLPGPAAAAEQALRAAAQAADEETNNQLVQWLQSLGPRGLETLVRIWLEREGFALLATLPPARGIGRLVVADPEADEDDRLLALVLPRKTAIDPTAWAGDAERNSCGGTLVFAMGEVPAEPPWGEGRTIEAPEFARWLRTQGIAVNSITIEACVLDPTVIESISGLDT